MEVISPVNIEERKTLDLRVGDTVRIHQKIEEKGKTRNQVFEGLVLARKHGSEAGATFTVRRTSSGGGVEKIFPLYSPIISKIEVIKRAKTRRAKLYYIREKASKEAARKVRQMRFEAVVVADEAARVETEKETEKNEEAEATKETQGGVEVESQTETQDIKDEGQEPKEAITEAVEEEEKK